jgi:hypothetical protein
VTSMVVHPNGGLTGPCVRGSQATLAHATVVVAAQRSRISVLTHIRGPLAPPIGALMQHGATRRARPARREET